MTLHLGSWPCTDHLTGQDPLAGDWPSSSKGPEEQVSLCGSTGTQIALTPAGVQPRMIKKEMTKGLGHGSETEHLPNMPQGSGVHPFFPDHGPQIESKGQVELSS